MNMPPSAYNFVLDENVQLTPGITQPPKQKGKRKEPKLSKGRQKKKNKAKERTVHLSSLSYVDASGAGYIEAGAAEPWSQPTSNAVGGHVLDLGRLVT